MSTIKSSKLNPSTNTTENPPQSAEYRQQTDRQSDATETPDGGDNSD